MLRLYIPSAGRSGSQKTLLGLPPELQRLTTLVVPREEAGAYSQWAARTGCAVSPTGSATGIGPVRQRIVDTHDLAAFGPKIVMLDDDLRFDTRRSDEPTKFTPATAKDISTLFRAVDKALNKFAHVGVSAREGGNRRTEPQLTVGRMMRVLAYDVDVLRRLKIRWARLSVMEDFDVTLQLLRAGKPNCLINTHVQGQGTSNAAGGCSKFRTPQVQTEAAEKLHALHPAFVKVVQKATKTAWGGGLRTDVTIQWARAYAASRIGGV